MTKRFFFKPNQFSTSMARQGIFQEGGEANSVLEINNLINAMYAFCAFVVN